jgi:hypothetical protein
MVQKYIASQHERDKNKSILPPQYVLSRILYNQKLQGKNHEFEGKDMILTGTLIDLQVRLGMRTPITHSTSVLERSLSTISLSCIDKKKDTKMTTPYALALENVTTDVGPISSHGKRKIDARHYNGFLPTPGIVYHMTSKIQNSLLNDRYGNPFEMGIINFIT